MKKRRKRELYVSAIEKKEFKTYVQKIVDAKSFAIVGGEVLARWNRPGKGLVPPRNFIEQMIRVDAIAELDYFIFEETCKWQQELRLSGKNLFLSCNFTRITISKADFIKRVYDIVKKYNFDHSKIIIEITEDCVETNDIKALSNIIKCKELGLLIAIDDFGSGNSSFGDFSRYPADIVKMSRSVLLKKDGLHNLFSRISDMGFKILCEGVETKEQAEMLRSFGCDYIQGFYFGRPEPKRSL